MSWVPFTPGLEYQIHPQLYGSNKKDTFSVRCIEYHPGHGAILEVIDVGQGLVAFIKPIQGSNESISPYIGMKFKDDTCWDRAGFRPLATYEEETKARVEYHKDFYERSNKRDTNYL